MSDGQFVCVMIAVAAFGIMNFVVLVRWAQHVNEELRDIRNRLNYSFYKDEQ